MHCGRPDRAAGAEPRRSLSQPKSSPPSLTCDVRLESLERQGRLQEGRRGRRDASAAESASEGLVRCSFPEGSSLVLVRRFGQSRTGASLNAWRLSSRALQQWHLARARPLRSHLGDGRLPESSFPASATDVRHSPPGGDRRAWRVGRTPPAKARPKLDARGSVRPPRVQGTSLPRRQARGSPGSVGRLARRVSGLGSPTCPSRLTLPRHGAADRRVGPVPRRRDSGPDARSEECRLRAGRGYG